MIVDAHQHFWRRERGDYDWLTPELGAIYRDFSPTDLEPLLKRRGVVRTVLVQAAPTVEETEFLLSIAARNPFVGGVVGWAPLDRGDAHAVIDDLARRPGLVGLRPMIQDIPDERWMLRDDVGEALRLAQRRGLRFDALVKPHHLPHLRTLLERHPDLRVVVDHCAKPDVAAGRDWSGFASWSDHMRGLAANDRVCCKLSGLATEAGKDWSREDLMPFVDVVLEAFGPRRVMWGSDWPVLLLAGDYDGWLDAAQALTRELDEPGRRAVFGGTAAAFYGIAGVAS